MSSKRVLDLERAKEKVKRLKARIKEEEERFAVYLREELGYHLRRHFDSVKGVVYFNSTELSWTKILFANGCDLRVPPPIQRDIPQLFCEGSQLFCEGSRYLALYRDDESSLTGCVVHDLDMIVRLTAIAAVLPDARRIVRDILPSWRANPPCAEVLMTTRVLHWLAKEYRGASTVGRRDYRDVD